MYPILKQVNITNVICDYTEQNKIDMINFIEQKIDFCNTKENKINNCISLKKLENVEV